MSDGPSLDILATLARRRIEACLNACDGVATADLERLGVEPFAHARARLTRYQDLVFRMLPVLGRVCASARDNRPPPSLELLLLDALRVEADGLLHEETH